MNPLERKIAAEIGRQGVISFARFMELALYCPVYGYYEREEDIIGPRGDYYTSVSVGALFGELLAFRFGEWLREGGSQLVEAGAHQGYLARDILMWFQKHDPDLFHSLQYSIVEPSPRRRQWQKGTLQAFAERIRWVNTIAELGESAAPGGPGPSSAAIRGVIFSNEFLDALPVHRFGWDTNERRWFEWGVACGNTGFRWRRMPASSRAPERSSRSVRAEPVWSVLESVPAELLAVLPEGYTVEICPGAVQWWRSASLSLVSGKLLTIDYGLSRGELLMPERPQGTLRAYRAHHVSRDLLACPGEQDLTSHVNFDAIQATGESAGLMTEAFETQSRFLTSIAARAWKDPIGFGPWTPAHTRQFQTLTHPSHLGHAFRVLVQAPYNP